jgi:peptidyl-prolyl cis-trans isomerase C
MKIYMRGYQMQLKKYKPCAAIFCFMVLALTATHLCAAETPPPEGTLAQVNGVAITKGELDMELNRVKKQAQMKQSPIAPSDLQQIREELLDTLINRELLYQESIKKGYEIQPAELDSEFETIKARFANQQGFQQALNDMNISEAGFKQQVKKGLSIQKLLGKEIYEKLVITDQESRSFYDNNPNFFQKPEQVRASHILIKVAADDDDEKKAAARKKIEEVQEKIKAGEDFTQLAKTYSQGPSSTQGGDLGYFDRQKMVKPFSDAAFRLQPGEISPIVETRFGYHIIKVVDRKPETKLAYEDIKPRLVETLKKKKMQEAIAQYIKEIKSGASIKRFPV